MVYNILRHPQRRVTNRKQNGMTLLELLVVMVILALVSSLLVQGIGTALVTYERVQHQQQQSMEPTLAYSWLKSSLQGAQAELDEPRQFSGTSEHLLGYTHQSLMGESGQVHAFSWHLEYNQHEQLQLVYRQPNIEWPVLTWPKNSQASFVYLTTKGKPVKHWPYYGNKQAQADGRMPSAVILEITEPGLPTQRWYTYLSGRQFPRPDYRSMQ